jgi:RNA polymerase sigma factor (sigma-70 family)
MLFDFDKHCARFSTRAIAPQRLEERQRDVYESHRHRVFSVSYYMTGNEIEAEDLLRGTFVAAFRKVTEPDQATIDVSLVENLRSHMLLEEEEFVPVPAVATLSERQNIHRADLEEAIRCLPPTERLVFLLMDVEGYPSPRIAELLQMDEPAVRRTAMLARMRLRSELAAMQQDGQQAA